MTAQVILIFSYKGHTILVDLSCHGRTYGRSPRRPRTLIDFHRFDHRIFSPTQRREHG